MTTSDETAPKAGPSRRSFGRWLKDMPRWEQIALAVAAGAVVVGGTLSLFAGDPDPAAAGGGDPGAPGALGAGLVPDPPLGGRSAGQPQAPQGEPTSKGVFRLGFSFLAGFCMGTFLRAVLKLAAIAVGFWLVMTFVLSYAGLVVVDWDAMDALWSRFAGSVEDEWGSFQSFMLGSLPATGLAVTGLAVGLKRR